jgi:hypothetical protein
MQSKRFLVDSPVGSDSSSRRMKAEFVSTDHPRLLVTAVTSAWRVIAQYPASPYAAVDVCGFHLTGRASTGVEGTAADLLARLRVVSSDRRL